MTAKLDPDARYALAHRDEEALAFLRDALADMRRRADTGQRPCAIFDIDNTLVDTRPRTLAATRSWDGDAHHVIRSVALDDVRWDGRETALGVGAPDTAADAFHDHWDRIFWDGASFVRDTAIESVCAWARAVVAEGFDLVYLSGRIQAYTTVTHAQLDELLLPVGGPGELYLKPDMTVPTRAFKANVVAALQRDRGPGAVAWFASDSAIDLDVAREAGVPSVAVDFPVQPSWARPFDAHAVRLRP